MNTRPLFPLLTAALLTSPLHAQLVIIGNTANEDPNTQS
jgi:hypothetical protein